MSVKSGKVTFGSIGTKNVLIGIPFQELQLYGGARSSSGVYLLAIGHADGNKQFCHTIPDGNEDPSQTKCLVVRNESGVKVLEMNVSGGWGTSTITFNVTVANANYPFEIVART